jgi:adenosylcobinamide-phosphate synthase
MVSRALLASAGILADRVLGEPPASVHPVVAFGRTMRAVERARYRDARVAGVAHAATGAGIGLAAGAVIGSTAMATWLAVAGRALSEAAMAVASALDAEDLPRARALLPALVGRDPSGLDEKELARAVVESVAENTVDAVVAPALWAGALGAPGALGYRAVNTLDAMVGHRSDRYTRYGWASARLDDIAGWVPARITAVLVATVRPCSAGAVWTAVRTQAPAHPSPNAGVAEAAFAAALDLRRGGENHYGDRVEIRPPLGTGRPAERGDIARAVALLRDVSLALGAVPVVKWAVSAHITTRHAPRGRR